MNEENQNYNIFEGLSIEMRIRLLDYMNDMFEQINRSNDEDERDMLRSTFIQLLNSFNELEQPQSVQNTEYRFALHM